MKHLLLIFLSFLFWNNYSLSQTTATNFIANDCVGNPHTLFSELDAGEIIVIAWVMPCGGCTAAALAAYNAVQSYTLSNPHKVFFYLVDDLGNTSCSTLTAWGNTNSMPAAIKFSNSTISMADYGTAGMPKIVILSGTDHAIAYNQNTTAVTTEIQSIIDGLLTPVEVSELTTSAALKAKIIPNPSKNNIILTYSLSQSSSVEIEIYTSNGTRIFQTKEMNQNSGEHSFILDDKIQLSTGQYILTIKDHEITESIKFVIEE